MLLLYTATPVTIPVKCDDYYIKELASGVDELVFNISIWDPAFPAMQEQGTLKEMSDGITPVRYMIKAIDAGDGTATVKCVLDLDDWNAAFAPTFEVEALTVAEVITSILPTGWTLQDESGIETRRSWTAEGVTPGGILDVCRDVYPGITYSFDNINNVITLHNMDAGEDLGAFVTRQLNLRKSNYKGKSTGLATRLYAYGKDGLSFADINDGKEYIDNNTYYSRIISAYWKDERYEDPAQLLAAATEKLAAMAVPSRSFDCDIVDLAAADPDRYDYLSFPLFSKVALIDETRSPGKIMHKVVERWIYPKYPDKNKVVLSTAPPRLQSQVQQLVRALNNQNSEYNLSRTAAQLSSIARVTADILGAKGGAVRLLDTNADGYPDTLYIADNADPALAQKVWRWNYEGWGASSTGFDGPFTLAATLESGMVADFITAGTLNAENVNVTNINGENIRAKTIGNAPMADGAIYNNNVASSTLTTANMSDGINSSLAGGTQASQVFNNGAQAQYGSFNQLLIQGRQYLPSILAFVDGLGNQRQFEVLMPPSD